MKSVNVVQHHPAEGPGVIAQWAQARGLPLQVFRADLGHLPSTGNAPVILLGGPYESKAGPQWLEAERQWLQACVDQGAGVFAICLGSQLLALSLGGDVRRMARPETGWTAVTFSDGQALKVLQWHEDTFDLPPGAQLLASSAQCPHQMYNVGPQRFGVQFHPEWNNASVAELNAHFADESPLPRGKADEQAFAKVAEWFYATLDQWWAACH